MTFLEFIRSKGFTTKSLAEEAGVSARTLEAYTRTKNKYKWENTGLGITVRLASVLNIDPEDFLQFDIAKPDPDYIQYKTYTAAYYAKRRKPDPEKWVIKKNGDYRYLERKN